MLSNGVTVSLRLRKREQFGQKRTATQGKVETGYKISDGTVTDQPVVNIDGIITGSDGHFIAYDDIAASSEVASLQAAFNADELVSVYTSFIALADAVWTEFKADMVPDKKLINISLSAQGIRFANFSQTTGQAPSKKTSAPKGQGTTNGGKKSTTPVTPKEEPKHDILYFGERT